MNCMSDDNDLIAINPSVTPPSTSGNYSKHLYNFPPMQHQHDSTIGAGVFDTHQLVPPHVSHNPNLFNHSSGIKFKYMDTRLIRPISPYQFAKGFRYSENIIRKLAEHYTFISLLMVFLSQHPMPFSNV